jgi:hypothetical protein
MDAPPPPSARRQSAPPLTVTVNEPPAAEAAAASSSRASGGGGGLVARALGALRARLPWRGERARLDERYVRLRCALGLTADELWGLHTHFAACNASGSGAASLPELLAFLDLDRSFLSERVYNLYRDGGAGIGFQAWVLATWNLCSRDADGLAFFAFNVYDIYGRGWLGLLEVSNLLREVYGEGYEAKHTARATLRKLCHVDVRGRPVGARVGFRRFLEVTRSAGVLLFPAFELQRVLQERTGGVGRWEALTRRRAAGVADGSLDIRAITAVANEGRPRRRSVVAVSEAHFMPATAALADGGAHALPEGLRGVAAARQRRASAAAPLLQSGSASDYVPGGRRRGSGSGGGGGGDDGGDDVGDDGTSPLPAAVPTVDPATGALVMPAIDVDGVEDADAADAQEADAAATRAAMGQTATSRRLSLRAAASVRYGGARGGGDGGGGGAGGGRRLARGSLGSGGGTGGGSGGVASMGGRASAPSAFGGRWADDELIPPPVDAAAYAAHDSRASNASAVADAAEGGGSAGSSATSGGSSGGGSGSSDVSTTGALARLPRQPHLAGPVRAATTTGGSTSAASSESAALAQRLARVGATRRGNNTGAAAMRAAAKSARGQV